MKKLNIGMIGYGGIGRVQFLKAISENTPSVPTLADGLRIQEIMEAATRSSEENRWVSVDAVR